MLWSWHKSAGGCRVWCGLSQLRPGQGVGPANSPKPNTSTSPGTIKHQIPELYPMKASCKQLAQCSSPNLHPFCTCKIAGSLLSCSQPLWPTSMAYQSLDMIGRNHGSAAPRDFHRPGHECPEPRDAPGFTAGATDGDTSGLGLRHAKT